MGKQYISTGVVGNAHLSDILDVQVSKYFTISCSSDGLIKLWNNNSTNSVSGSPVSPQAELLVDSIGLHHVSFFEDIIGETRILYLSAVSFSGKCYILNYDYDTNTLHIVKQSESLAKELFDEKNSYWACLFSRDLEGSNHKLALTMVSGITQVFSVSFDDPSGSTKPQINIQLANKTPENGSTFALCLDIDPVNHKLIVGHQNGTAYLYDLDSLSPIYSFSNTGLKQQNSPNLSTVRCVKFSPGGTILAVARDSGSYGVVTLYDVKYGESIGTLTAATHSANIGIGGFTHEGWCMSVSFNEEGDLLATAGMDDKIRIWALETKTREATITISKADADDSTLEVNKGTKNEDMDNSFVSCLKFIKKGVLSDAGQNDGLVMVGFDRMIRWFREAGGI